MKEYDLQNIWTGADGQYGFDGLCRFDETISVDQQRVLWAQFQQNHPHGYRIEKGINVITCDFASRDRPHVGLVLDSQGTESAWHDLWTHGHALQVLAITTKEPRSGWESIMYLFLTSRYPGGVAQLRCAHCGQPGDHLGMVYNRWTNTCSWF